MPRFAKSFNLRNKRDNVLYNYEGNGLVVYDGRVNCNPCIALSPWKPNNHRHMRLVCNSRYELPKLKAFKKHFKTICEIRRFTSALARLVLVNWGELLAAKQYKHCLTVKVPPPLSGKKYFTPTALQLNVNKFSDQGDSLRFKFRTHLSSAVHTTYKCINKNSQLENFLPMTFVLRP